MWVAWGAPGDAGVEARAILWGLNLWAYPNPGESASQ